MLAFIHACLETDRRTDRQTDRHNGLHTNETNSHASCIMVVILLIHQALVCNGGTGPNPCSSTGKLVSLHRCKLYLRLSDAPTCPDAQHHSLHDSVVSPDNSRPSAYSRKFTSISHSAMLNPHSVLRCG